MADEHYGDHQPLCSRCRVCLACCCVKKASWECEDGQEHAFPWDMGGWI